MPKNIVLCCDGTGNSFDNVKDDSNVAKIYSTLTSNAEQICYYHPGVGTMGAQNARSTIGRKISQYKGLAFGSGLLDHVGDGYEFLMDNFADGDRIYLFGFSRGAYTARAIASILHVYGLLCVGNHAVVPYVLRMYSHCTREANHRGTTFKTDDIFKWQFTHSRPVTIHFCGVWDTVSSYGWVYDPIELPFQGMNPIIKTGRHAISIDERRCYYQDNLWGKPDKDQDFRQVWFSGVHSDVGGSYDERESGLSKIALEWMLCEADKAGLKIDRQKADILLGKVKADPPVVGMPAYVKPNENACLHKSLCGWWWIPEFIFQRDPHLRGGWVIPHGRRRKIPDHSHIHASVLKSKWCPKNLPEHYTVEPHVAYGIPTNLTNTTEAEELGTNDMQGKNPPVKAQT
jgi:uncharacterized protein (DUF2235 family)